MVSMAKRVGLGAKKTHHSLIITSSLDHVDVFNLLHIKVWTSALQAEQSGEQILFQKKAHLYKRIKQNFNVLIYTKTFSSMKIE